MELLKTVFISKQLLPNQGVGNTLTFQFPALSDIPLNEIPVIRCSVCYYPIVNPEFCVFCKHPSPPSWKSTADKSFYLNQKNFKIPIQKIQSYPSFIVCIDTSGSTGYTYQYSEQTQQNGVLSEFRRNVGQKNFTELISQLSEEVIIDNQHEIAKYLDWGVSVAQIVNSMFPGRSKSQKSGGVFGKTQHYSRKKIIQLGLENFLARLAYTYPNSLVYVMYFNGQVIVPTNQYLGFEKIRVEDRTPQEVFELGKQHAINFKPDIIRKDAQKILKSFDRLNPNGQTALGPTLTFSLGLASALPTRTQIILITDGESNIGFGETCYGCDQDYTSKFYKELTLTKAVPISARIHLMRFGDERIGFENKLSHVVDLSGGIPFQLEIENKKFLKGSSLESYYRQFQLQIQSISTLVYAVRIAIFTSCPQVQIKIIDEYFEQFSRNLSDNHVLLELGAAPKFKKLEVQFSTKNELSETVIFNLTMAVEYVCQGVQYVMVSDRLITIKPGSKEQADMQMMKCLEHEFNMFRVNPNKDFDSFKHVHRTISRRRQLVPEEDMLEFENQFNRMMINEQKIKERNEEQYSIRYRRRGYD